ncbi:hypothetical protein LSTR_LSTR012109 [Laodelphax striatellus]|uniref:Protein kinase C-binding protein 1 n=1 Tax=Laodelphax striatellus TaxID=195883 RepID=A0A482WYB9_LAOST|nr:hypothetical protein LSTR_LSTR012109 [Laodelphax striatellus]
MEKDPDYSVEMEEEEEEEEETMEEEESTVVSTTTRSSRSRSVPGRMRKTSSGEIGADRASSLRSTRLSVNPDFAAKHRRFLNSVSDSLEAAADGKRSARSSRDPEKRDGRLRERAASRAGKSQDRCGKSQDQSGKTQDSCGKSQDQSGKTQDSSGKSQDQSGKSQDKPVAKTQDRSRTTSQNDSSEDNNKLVTKSLGGGSSQDKTSSKQDRSGKTSQNDSSEDNNKLVTKSLDSNGGGSSQDKTSSKSIDSSDNDTDKSVLTSSQDSSDKITDEPSMKSLESTEESTDKSTDKTVSMSSQEESDKVLDESQSSPDKSTDKSVLRSSPDETDQSQNSDEPEKDASGEEEEDDDDEDDTPLRAVRSRFRLSETRKRGREEEEGEEKEGEEQKEMEEESPKRKKRSMDKSADTAPKPIREGKDMYCWKCHREGTAVACKICPRVFHLRCLHLETTPPFDWVCPECSSTLYAENTETRSTAMKSLTLDQLCNLLKFTLARMNSYPGSEWFLKPVDTQVFKDYRSFVVNPMDLSYLEKNIKHKVYGSTHAFYADTQWLLHNSVIYNSHQSKMSNIAKVLVKICKQELDEIETCPECYLNAHTRKDSWFIEACKRPHILVWAKLKGFPFWPAKAMKTNADNLVDVRFFGAHDRAWIPIKFVYLYSKLNPGSAKNKRKSQFDDCILEVQQHIKKLRDRFGEFVYPPFKCMFDANKEEEQLEAMLPGYKAASRRYGKLLGPYRNFSSPSTSSQNEVKKEFGASAKRKLTPEKSRKKTNEDNPSSQNSSKSLDTNELDKEENNDVSREKEGEEEEDKEGKKMDSQTLSPKAENSKEKSNTDPTKGGVVTSTSSTKSVKFGEESGSKEDVDKSGEKEETKRNDDEDEEPLAKRRQLDENHHQQKPTENSPPTKTDHAASLQEKLQLMLKKEMVDSLESKEGGEEEEEEMEEDVEEEKKKEKEEEVSKKGDDDNVVDGTTTEGGEKSRVSEESSKENEKDVGELVEVQGKDDESVTNDEGKDDDNVGEKNTEDTDLGASKGGEEGLEDKENYAAIIKKEVEDVDETAEKEVVDEEVDKEADDATPHIDLTTDDHDEVQEGSKLRVIVGGKSEEKDSLKIVETKPKVLDTIRATINEVVKNADFLCSRKMEANKKLSGIVDNLNHFSKGSLNRFSKGLEKLSRNSSITIAKTIVDCDDEEDLDIDNPKLISLLRARDPNCCSPEEMERVLAPNRRKGFPSKVRRNGSTASSSCSSDVSSVEELRRICVEQELRSDDRKRPSTTPIDELTDDSYSVLDEVSGQFMKKRMEKGNVTITLISDDESPKPSKSQQRSVCLSKDVSLSIIREDNKKDLSLDMECVESDTDEIENGKRSLTGNVPVQVKPTARKSFPNAPNYGHKTTLTKTKDGGSEMSRRLSAAEVQVMNQQNGAASSSAKTSPVPSPKSASSAFYTKISKIAASSSPGSEEVQISNTMSLKIHPVESKTTGSKTSSPQTSSGSLSATVAPISSASRPVPTAVTQAARVLPQLQLKPPAQSAASGLAAGRSILRGNFGPNTARMDAMSQKVAENMMQMMEDLLQEMAQEGRHEARIKQMQLEMERSHWKYRQEMAEYKHNTDLMIMEMRAGFEAEKHRAINEVRMKCEAEKEAAINETKMKQWCALCKKEALFYCCWNTAYCNYPCQKHLITWRFRTPEESLTVMIPVPLMQEHWPQHMANCAQTNRANQEAANAKTTSPVKMLTAPFTTTTTVAGQKTVTIPPSQNHVHATTTLVTSAESNQLLSQQNSLVPLHHALPSAVTMTHQHQMTTSGGGMRMMRAPVMLRPNFAIRPPQHFMVTPRGPMPHPGFFQ